MTACSRAFCRVRAWCSAPEIEIREGVKDLDFFVGEFADLIGLDVEDAVDADRQREAAGRRRRVESSSTSCVPGIAGGLFHDAHLAAAGDAVDQSCLPALGGVA